MRKYQQKQLLEIIEILRQAHSAAAYGSAQDGAIELAETIDEIAGEGTKAVALLLEYCEQLFKVSNQELPQNILSKQISAIEKSIINELRPNKLEVAILSFNASMSDSVLSIYEAANADDSCDAYFIPIPYLKRTDDGGDMICEGQEFYPDHIKCTDWQSYNIEQRRPDVVITNAPYDGTNYNYNVHSRFYCKNLRTQTDCLIYVPYFVSLGDQVEDVFCLAPGILYAHKVIVQSEGVRDSYIQAFRKGIGRKHRDFENKVIALGSPKFDAVMNAKRFDFVLPKEWEALIAGQSVILYITTATGPLRDPEKYIKKMKNIFETFSKRNDAVLWWRPHPYAMDVFRNQCPESLKDYEIIVEAYRNEGWGVYDDSKELHRAIAYSDAYYGDVSSVLALYQYTGKPWLILDNQLENNGIHKSVDNFAFSAFIEYKGILYACDKTTPALHQIETNTGKCKYIGSITEKYNHYECFAAAVAADDKIYFIPGFSRDIAVYDIKKAIIYSIELDIDYEPSKFLSCYACEYKGNIFIFGCNYACIICLDTKTEQISYLTDWVETYHRNFKSEGAYFVPGMQAGNKAVLGLALDSAIAIYDMQSRQMEFLITKKEDIFNGVCYDGTNYWLAGATCTYPSLRLDKNGEEHLTDLPNGFTESDWWIIVYANDYVWHFSGFYLGVFRVNIHTGISEVIVCDYEKPLIDHTALHPYWGGHNGYWAAVALGDKILAWNGRDMTLDSYDVKTCKKHSYTVTQEALNQYLKSVSKRMGTESKAYQLKEYIDDIVNETVRNEQKKALPSSIAKGTKGTYGENIYNYIKNQVLGTGEFERITV